ncbi:MAG: CHAT domain-containing protein, partial [Pseudomonadota bacterium]
VLRGRAVRSDGPTRFLGVGDPVIGNAPDMACEGTQLAQLRASGSWGSLPFSSASAWQDGMRLADPQALRRLDRLADTTCELEAIQRGFSPAASTLLTRHAASESRIKALSAEGTLAQQDIVVFATHGLVAGESSAVAPGLVLTPPGQATLLDDGLLTSAEVAVLDLNARLVILSACNTAAGESAAQEGLSGLASSFFHAGARALIVTHWAVFSAASAEISAGVAQRIANDPALENAEALRVVTLDILDDPGGSALRKHPAYWAAFSVIGD